MKVITSCTETQRASSRKSAEPPSPGLSAEGAVPRPLKRGEAPGARGDANQQPCNAAGRKAPRKPVCVCLCEHARSLSLFYVHRKNSHIPCHRWASAPTKPQHPATIPIPNTACMLQYAKSPKPSAHAAAPTIHERRARGRSRLACGPLQREADLRLIAPCRGVRRHSRLLHVCTVVACALFALENSCLRRIHTCTASGPIHTSKMNTRYA